MNELLIIFVGMIAIALIVEASLLLVGFLFADEVECNLLWCTFTKQSHNIKAKCFMNGERINCSEIGGIGDIYEQYKN